MLIRQVPIFLLLTLSLIAGEQPYWVFFEDTPSREHVKLTPRAEQRLLQRGQPKAQGNYHISAHQLDQLRRAGFKIRHASRFLNAVSVEIENQESIRTLKQLSFVLDVQPVAQRIVAKSIDMAPTQLSKGTDFSYGSSLTQNEMLHIPTIHDLGYDGKGILIGVFDAGFNTGHPVFDQLDVQATYDFVDHEINPDAAWEEHGINVLSTLGGYMTDKLIGPAFGAGFLLARTEDVTSESRIEEDNWLAALEWADSLGVDIISSSLNYRDFDDSTDDYPFSAIDGQTTIISRAANIAAERGILVVNSMGNEGPASSSVWPPADSPHVLSVGAVDAQQGIIAMSGRGPTYDGRIKPDVLAMGFAVYVASGADQFTFISGTSVATPLISGLAALLLQAHPNLSPDSVIALFHSHGSYSNAPDNMNGYGVPDLLGLFPKLNQSVTKNCLIYPNPSSANTVKLVLPIPVSELIRSGHIYSVTGQLIAGLDLVRLSETTLLLTLPKSQLLASQLIIITVETERSLYSGKLVYLK